MVLSGRDESVVPGPGPGVITVSSVTVVVIVFPSEFVVVTVELIRNVDGVVS